MTEPKLRDYPDWHRLVPARFREEVYNGNDDWVLYYNVDWASFLYYCHILHYKEYVLEGGLPDWLESYIDSMAVVSFDYNNEDIILTFKKDKWVTNTLTFHLDTLTTKNGTAYNMSSKIIPSPEFLAGEQAPGVRGCPQSVWEPYLIAYANHLFPGDAWNPVSK